MFDKVQESLKRSKDERQKKRLEKERLRLEKAAAEAAREEERLQQEAQKIQTEKERLLSLDDKGLMVELILAMRGLYAQIEDIQFQQITLTSRIEDIESDTINSAVFSSTRLLTLQTRLSAAYKGIMALLYKEKCRDFMNNTTIDIVNSMLESPDIHHIFPEAYCEKMGIKRERYNSIINKTPILPATNRSIGGNAPSEYLGAILKKVDGLTENELQARVESHFINYAELKADDFNGYFIDRAKSLLNLIEKAMNKPVTDRDAENTLDQFGASLA